MARIFLTNFAADIPGYKLALVDSRNPNSSALVTSVTATTASGTKIQMTDTSGGNALKWITTPLRKAVTLSAVPMFINAWAQEDAAATNSSFEFDLLQYTAGAEGSTVVTAANSTELGTAIALSKLVSGNLTSTAFAKGDRLVIKGYAVNVGTMAVGTVTFDYDGPTMGADGDSYLYLNEDFPVKRQFGGPVPLLGSAFYSRGYIQGIIDEWNALISGQIVNAEEPIQTTLDRFADERDAR